MDDNWNPRNNRSDDGQWDRWNSNASNSSYYNQPVHKPYGQSFSMASFVLGVLSVTTGCCGFSLPLGALGILFALLVHRKGRKLNSTAKSGLTLSCIGVFLGICTIIYVQLTMPRILQQFQDGDPNSSGTTYGTDYDNYINYLNRYYDYIRNRYGISVEE